MSNLAVEIKHESNQSMQTLRRDDLHLGGFAGLKEHRLVTDRRIWGRSAAAGAWNGLGNFVYLADARFMPKGETHMHPHKEIDVISFMLEGRIAHEGSLEHGEELKNYDVQVQRAGGEGFQHNEVNPDDDWNRMIQLWVVPETPGAAADYKKYEPQQGQVTRIYGGDEHQKETFAAKTEISVALLESEQTISVEGEFMAYVTKGTGLANDQIVREGDLIKSKDLHFTANNDVHMIIIRYKHS